MIAAPVDVRQCRPEQTPAPVALKRMRLALGTFVAVEAIAPDRHTAARALEAAFNSIDRVDRRMHPHRSGSELARVNEAPANRRLAVDQDVLALLHLARHLKELTGGVFDPCRPERPGRLQDIVIEGHTLTCRKPVALDFGGFAKGLAVDQAIAALRDGGCAGGLVNAGGDLRVLGVSGDPIVIRDSHGNLACIEMANAALAVSDVDSANRPPEHQGYYVHEAAEGANPHGRLPAIPPFRRRHAAVLAREAVIADALTKCALLCEDSVADRAMRAFGATRVILTPPDGGP